MLALTIWRPWPWAIFDLPAEVAKDIENRTWEPPASVIGRFIAIHAGKTEDDENANLMIREISGKFPPADSQQGVIGIARIVEVVRESPSPWFVGPVGWRLADRMKFIDPVPCRGMQKLWTVPGDIEALVRVQIARMK